MSEDIYIGTEGEVSGQDIRPAKKYNVQLDVSNNNVQESGRRIIDLVQQNPDILITRPDVKQDKITFVVASGSDSITEEEVKGRVQTFQSMFRLPFTLKEIRVTDQTNKE